MPSYGGYVYILSNDDHSLYYVGYTASLLVRMAEHIHERDPKCFTARRKLKVLLYYEVFERIEYAYAREQQLKGWSRMKKEFLIRNTNPGFDNLILDYGDSEIYPSIAELDPDSKGRELWVPSGEMLHRKCDSTDSLF